MPRLSLYRPEKGSDYKFIDNTIWEMFQVGGVDVLVHRYIGPGDSAENTPTTPVYSTDDPTHIQDLLFLENRDRKYDPSVYVLRGHYNVQDIDFNLSQFGLFLQNDTIFVSFHINDTVEKLGRKIISGDVIELPHLKDEYALNDLQFALKRFYVVEEVSRASQGFSALWYPHLYRAKCKPLVDSQEFKDILSGLADEDGESDLTLRDIMSTYEKEMQITHAVLDQADADLPLSGYSTENFYVMRQDRYGLVEIASASYDMSVSAQEQATDEHGNVIFDANGDPIYVGTTASMAFQSPSGYTGTVSPTSLQPNTLNGYSGYLVGDGLPPNGAQFTAGISFPIAPVNGQFCLRTDYQPKRLFQFDGLRWIKIEDSVRMNVNNFGYSDTGVGDEFEGKAVRQNQKGTFINNDTVATIDGHVIKEKQSLSKALRPEAD